MKVIVKILFISLFLGIILVVTGIATGATVDSTKEILKDTSAYIEYNETIKDSFETIYIKTDNKNVNITVSNEITEPQLKYYLKETETMTVTVSNSNQLNIVIEKEQKFFNWFSFGFMPSNVTTLFVTLPSTFQNNLKIETKAGNITLGGGTFQNLDFAISAGNIRISNTNVNGDVNLNNKSGNITFEDSKVMGHIDLSVSAGNIGIDHVAAQSYTLESSAGNVTIRLQLNQSAYQLNLKTSAGNIRVNGTKTSKEYKAGTGIIVNAKTSAGNIKIHTK